MGTIRVELFYTSGVILYEWRYFMGNLKWKTAGRKKGGDEITKIIG
jgi:hypothetical protein